MGGFNLVSDLCLRLLKHIWVEPCDSGLGRLIFMSRTAFLLSCKSFVHVFLYFIALNFVISVFLCQHVFIIQIDNFIIPL